MTITREWLQKQIAEFESCAERTDGYRLDEGGENTLEALRIALVSLEAEAVAYMTYKGYLLHAGDPKVAEYSEPMPLYDAPQTLTTSERAELENYRNAQQVVTEQINSITAVEPDWSDPTNREPGIWAYGWNECRAAMQPGAVKDGWVMVPVEPTAEMISAGIAAHYERAKIQIHDRPAPGPIECAYVAMVAAAPQQEAE